MTVAGLLVGLAAAEARAACQDGVVMACTIANGCPGEKSCDGLTWGACEPMSGSKSCSVCGGSGTQQCNSEGVITTTCSRPEQCNACDDDHDGLVDEGLASCVGGATCGSTFEVCGDGLDNDCDGLTDEGCSTCTSGAATVIPFVFGTQLEMRRDTVGSGVYGRQMNSTWRFLPSHRMSSWTMTFDQVFLEQSFDFFFAGSAMLTGTPALPSTTAAQSISAGTATTFSLFTDGSVQNTGVRTTSVNVKCNSGGGGTFNAIDLNKGADGVLLYKGDNAYAQFTLPAGREAFINLDHNFGAPVDFDMFVTENSALFGTSCANSSGCGISTAPTGEVVHIEALPWTTRIIKVNITSYTGAGRYRLFVASPVASFTNDLELAFESNIPLGSAGDVRAKAAWGRAQRTMMNATDGQFRVREHAIVSRDITCFSCYDIVFTNQTSMGGPACTPAVTTPEPVLERIEVARPFWDGSTSWVDNGTPCANTAFTPDQVGDTLVHEWGHYDFSHDDERTTTSPALNRCGFSLMSGSGLTNFNGGNRHFEFCGDARHGLNPATGATAMTGASNWEDIINFYPSMVEPPGTGDFSRMSRLGEMMEAGNFVSFEED